MTFHLTECGMDCSDMLNEIHERAKADLSMLIITVVESVEFDSI